MTYIVQYEGCITALKMVMRIAAAAYSSCCDIKCTVQFETCMQPAPSHCMPSDKIIFCFNTIHNVTLIIFVLLYYRFLILIYDKFLSLYRNKRNRFCECNACCWSCTRNSICLSRRESRKLYLSSIRNQSTDKRNVLYIQM